MKADQIRQSFLTFFEGKSHAIVPSASLLPEAPNLLFTNAGMNPFVPYFLGERTPSHRRVADTQKCIRAGGKHNDLDEVGFDTYHHTFFEMLGNWSFGDFFKREAITWAWELLTQVWKFPKERLYATIYAPEAGDPAELDVEAQQIWTEIFQSEGLDPKTHIVQGHKKDNFWMMGDTGPCGPCSEIHMDLTPEGDTQGSLVNKGDVRCIEIWNLVFIQYNALPNGQFERLKQHFVDTGMGFERVAGIFATTQNFKDFSKIPSNYDSDLFQTLFEALQKASGHKYGGQVPSAGTKELSPSVAADCAFRILADHSRTLTFAIADGILPGNEGRNYVLRRIVRRALLFGQKMKLPAGTFAQLASLVVQKMGPVFPELVRNQETIVKVLNKEEEAFHSTLERGLRLFEKWREEDAALLPGAKAFELYDTYGFPLDLTQLIAQEHHMEVDVAGFNSAMAQQKERSKASMKKQVIQLASTSTGATEFVGYEHKNLTHWGTRITDVVQQREKTYVLTESTPFYGERGGQVGDCGTLEFKGQTIPIVNTIVQGALLLHEVTSPLDKSCIGADVILNVDTDRRQAIARHHSATHLLHAGLMHVLGGHVHQAGSLVQNTSLRFDFSHFEKVSEDQLHAVEIWCNQQILNNLPVWTEEVDFDQRPEGCIAFFEDKYGDRVRIVHMGQEDPGVLCGGTHVQATGELGQFKILQESGIAAGIRRIEAVAGILAYEHHHQLERQLKTLAQQLLCPCDKIYDKYQTLLAQKKAVEQRYQQSLQKDGGHRVLHQETHGGLQCVQWACQSVDPAILRNLSKAALHEQAIDVLWTANVFEGKGSVAIFCSPKAVQQGIAAQALLQSFLATVEGRGGGKPDYAVGGTKVLDLLKTHWEQLSSLV